MVKPEDFLAAQRVRALRPQAAERIWAALEQVRLGARAGLLDALVLDGLLTLPQANEVGAAVAAEVARRAQQTYVEVVVGAGVPAEQVAACGRHARGARALGTALVQTGLLAPDRETQLRREAAERFRLDLERAAAEAWPLGAPLGAPARAGSPGPDTRPYAAGEVAAEPTDLRERPTDAFEPEALAARLDLQDRPTDAFDSATLAARLAGDELGPTDALDSAILVARLPDHQPPGPEPFVVPPGVDARDPRVGDRVGAFTIAGRVGAGAMGVVYLARDPERPALPVALKVLPPTASESAKGRFKREILANGFFDHEGALGIYDAGQTEGGEHFLAMEYFAGRDLGRTLQEHGRLPPAAAISVAIRVLETLAAAHQAGVVHRDVKPDNILVAPGGGDVRLMDFGIAIIRDLGEFAGQVFQSFGTGQVTGTPEYVSPEQASGMEVGPASDLYSLACVLFQCLAGRLPFESETPTGFVTQHIMEDAPVLAAIAPHTAALPSELHALLARAFEKDPDDRPSDEAALAILRSVQATLVR